jgi:hypothetical protein
MQATYISMFTAMRTSRRARVAEFTKLNARLGYTPIKSLSVDQLQLVAGGVSDSPKGSWSASVVSAG